LAKFVDEQATWRSSRRFNRRGRMGDAVFFVADKARGGVEISPARRATRYRHPTWDVVEKGAVPLLLDRRFPRCSSTTRRPRRSTSSHNPFLDGRRAGWKRWSRRTRLDHQGPTSTTSSCNGVELSSGRDPQPSPEIMYKAFGICGVQPRRRSGSALAGHASTPSSSARPPHGRLGAWCRSHRHAAGRWSPTWREGHRLSDEPSRRWTLMMERRRPRCRPSVCASCIYAVGACRPKKAE